MAQQSFEGMQVRNDLATNGYTLVEHGISCDAIDDLVASYAEFTDNLPDPLPATMNDMIIDPNELDDLNRVADKEPTWHKYRTNHPQFAKPGGYTNRSMQAAALRTYDRKVYDRATNTYVAATDDPKEYYHYMPNGLEEMRKMHDQYDWGPIPPEVKRLHARFEVIHALARSSFTKTMARLEETQPGITSRVRPEDLQASPIRLLFYHLGQGALLGQGHTDKGFGTIQLAESHVGFRCRTPGALTPEIAARYKNDPVHDPDMHLMRRPPQKGVLFMSKMYGETYPDSDIKPLWHDIVDHPELNEGRSVVGRNCARWALIFFANSIQAGYATKAMTHSEI